MSIIYAIYFYLTIALFFKKNGKKMWQNLVKTFKMATALMHAKQAQQTMKVVQYVPIDEEQHRYLVIEISRLKKQLSEANDQTQAWKNKFFQR
jgi:thioesterase domain-containing protein